LRLDAAHPGHGARVPGRQVQIVDRPDMAGEQHLATVDGHVDVARQQLRVSIEGRLDPGGERAVRGALHRRARRRMRAAARHACQPERQQRAGH